MITSDRKQSYRISILVMLLSAAVFSFIAWQVFVAGNLDFDRTITLFVHNFQSGTLTTIMLGLTFIGSSTFLLPAYVVLTCFCLFRLSRIEALMCAVTGLGGYLLIAILKLFFGRTRPVDSMIHAPVTFSFPSGHSGSGMTFFLLLAFLITRNQINRLNKSLVFLFFFAVAFFIGFSRIYLRVHYPTDVLAGFSVAAFWLSLMYLLYTLLSRAPYFTRIKSAVNQRKV